MKKIIRVNSMAAAICTLLWLLIGGGAWAQTTGGQVLAEVGVLGENSLGDGVIRPDLAGKETGDYVNWVSPGEVGDGRAFAISPKGTALVLDGNVIREFNVAGVEKGTLALPVNGFPVDCTALVFGVRKNNGQINMVSLSECGAFTPLNDGTLRIAGEAKGGGFVVIEYDPNNELTTLAADGTPPSISDMDGDEFKDAEDDRKGKGYWAVGDRKKVLFFPLGDEDNFEVVTTLNGKLIDSVTPFGIMPSGDGRVIVALDTGELLSINTRTGVATPGPVLTSAEGCGLGRKDPQKYSVRGDPSGVLFAGNRGGNSIGNCNAITLFDESLVQINATTNESLEKNPFILTDPELFLVEGLDWQSGQGGDFTEGCDDPLVLGDPESGCQYGAVQNQAIMFDVKVAQGVNFDTTYRMFQFVDLVDCRHSGDRPCPIINCPLADTAGGEEGSCGMPDEQSLDLTKLLIRADESGVFRQLAFGDILDIDLPVMAIPPYMRGEETYPGCSGGLPGRSCNNYKFVSFFAVTDAIFLKTFFVDYKINKFRPVGSDDECFIPPPGSSIAAVNETANLIVYNSGDGFGTVDRGGDQTTRGSVIGNSFCNGGASRARWSANTIGLEFVDDNDPELYVDQVRRMMAELRLVKEVLICMAFDNPEAPGDLGPLLLGSDCNTLEGQLVQVDQKLEVCIASLYAPQQGGSAENCNAFFTKITNLRSAADAAAWPLPASVANLDLLRPNYEGEFLARIDALEFFVESYLLNSVPPGGIIPLPTP